MNNKSSSKPSISAALSSISFRNFNMQGAVLSVVLLMIVVVPLVSGTSYLLNYGKPLVFEVLGCLLLALLVSQINFGSSAFESIKQRLKAGPTLAVVGLVIYAGFEYIFQRLPHSMELSARGEFFRIFFCAVIYGTVALYVRGMGRLQLLLDVLLVVGALVAIVSLGSIGFPGQQGNMHGTFGTHETLGSFLLFVLPFALPLALTESGGQKRQICAQIVTLLIAAALLMSQTRAAWLGSAISLFVLALLYLAFENKKKSNLSRAEKAAMYIGPPLIMSAAVALFVLTSQQGASFVGRASTISSLSADGSAIVRRKLALGAIKMIKLKPLFGWGLGSFPAFSYQFTGVGGSPDELLHKGLWLDNNAHSFYLQFSAEEGIFGMLLFLSIAISFLITAIKCVRTMPSGLRKSVLIGSIAACCGQLIDAAISPSYNLPSISMFQFLVIGIGTLAAIGLDFPDHQSETHEENVHRRRQSGRVPSSRQILD